MKPTKMYRIQLNALGGIANELATLAALSNGGKNYISLKEMEAIAKVDCIKMPYTNSDITVTVIGEHDLTIDRGTENLLHLTEISVLDLSEYSCPTVDRYDVNQN